MRARKRFLKPLAILTALFIVVQLGSFVFAETDNNFTEIVVGYDVDVQKAEAIENLIKGEELSASDFQDITPTANILCIFGHSMSQGTAVEINHRYWTNPTRCRRTMYNVEYCTRSSCNYMVLTQLGPSTAIICCT